MVFCHSSWNRLKDHYVRIEFKKLTTLTIHPHAYIKPYSPQTEQMCFVIYVHETQKCYHLLGYIETTQITK